MSPEPPEVLLDEDAGRLVPHYLATGGRTKASVALDRLTLVWSTHKYRAAHIDANLAEVMVLCREPMSVAEISAHLRLPSGSVKVLVSDLVEMDAVQTLDPESYDDQQFPPRELLEALLTGLQRRL
jgi:hypothetical protein